MRGLQIWRWHGRIKCSRTRQGGKLAYWPGIDGVEQGHLCPPGSRERRAYVLDACVKQCPCEDLTDGFKKPPLTLPQRSFRLPFGPLFTFPQDPDAPAIGTD